jgi:4-carboxymuconolactone decarboxylase
VIDGRPRIGPVEDPDEEQAELLSKTFAADRGRPLNVFATLAHHPLLLRRVNALGGAFMVHGTLPEREREFVILRVAAHTRSRYEFAQHAPLALRAGVTEDEVEGLTRRLDATAWTTGDLALLRFVDELLEHDTVDDASWEVMAARFEQSQLLELVLLIGYYRMIAGYLRGVRVEVEPALEPPDVATGPGWL